MNFTPLKAVSQFKGHAISPHYIMICKSVSLSVCLFACMSVCIFVCPLVCFYGKCVLVSFWNVKDWSKIKKKNSFNPFRWNFVDAYHNYENPQNCLWIKSEWRQNKENKKLLKFIILNIFDIQEENNFLIDVKRIRFSTK